MFLFTVVVTVVVCYTMLFNKKKCISEVNFCSFLVVSAYNCTLGEVRLADGVTDLEGRVEICLGSGWGTVSSSYWTNAEARIACYQAGFGGLGKQ